MTYGTVARTALDVAPSTPPAAAAVPMTSSRAADPLRAARRERLQAGLMLLALLSLTVAFWVAVIGLAVRA